MGDRAQVSEGHPAAKRPSPLRGCTGAQGTGRAGRTWTHAPPAVSCPQPEPGLCAVSSWRKHDDNACLMGSLRGIHQVICAKCQKGPGQGRASQMTANHVVHDRQSTQS